MATVISLNRGGYVIRFDEADDLKLQFVAPPETIKDSMALFNEAPQYFLLPANLIDKFTFLNNAEIEFPIYYNYFFKGRKTCIICQEKQKPALISMLQEALIGPVETDFAKNDYADPANYRYDIDAEMAYFRRKGDRQTASDLMTLKDMVSIITFNREKDTSTAIPGTRLSFRISAENKLVFSVDGKAVPLKDADGRKIIIDYKFINRLLKPRPPEALTNFKFPQLGFTFLGASNGFDKNGVTSGFIIWINGKGLLVDPPANIISLIEENNISLANINGVFLSHCHADHDAGILQNIIRGYGLKIYTTQTIWKSFKTKYGGLLGYPDDRFDDIAEFDPVVIDKAFNIENAVFRFHYALHVLPTLGFTMTYEGNSLFYSSDTCVSDTTGVMFAEKIMSAERYTEIISDFMKYDYVLHEAGGGSLHTHFDYLEKTGRGKNEITVYHTPKALYDKYKAENPESLLTYPQVGIAHTRVICPYNLQNRFDFLCGFKLFEDINIKSIREFEKESEFIDFPPDAVIIQENEISTDFYIIVNGLVDIYVNDQLRKKYISFDFFGETAALSTGHRTATVRAGAQGCRCLRINGGRFVTEVKSSLPLYQKLENLATIREKNSWGLFNHPNFADFTVAMKTYFEMRLCYVDTYKQGEVIWDEGDIARRRFGYFLMHGKVTLETANPDKSYTIDADAQKSFFCADIGNLLFDAHSLITRATVLSMSAAFFRIAKDDLKDYYKDYPIIYPRLNHFF